MIAEINILYTLKELFFVVVITAVVVGCFTAVRNPEFREKLTSLFKKKNPPESRK